jgi:hypothetical protein
MRKFFNRSSCSFSLFLVYFPWFWIVWKTFRHFLPFETSALVAGSQLRRAIKIAYCPWAIPENPASSAANQILRFIETNACHIIIVIIYIKIILDCDWLISMQLITNSSAKICNNSAKICNNSAKICNKLIWLVIKHIVMIKSTNQFKAV